MWRATELVRSLPGLRPIHVRFGALLLPAMLAACSGFGNTVKETGSTVKQAAKKTASTVVHTVKEFPGPSGGVVGGVLTVQKLGYLKPEYIAGSLIAFSIYDPLAPTWEIRVTELDAGYCRIDLNMKRLTTGGDGEARQTFLRAARRLVANGQYAGFDELRYEEGIDSTRPFAHRVASGEIRLVKSRQFPEF
jgi:predicted small secreted protein